MAFLGLGSFGEGFVTGFAESANEALKKDIERINTRIDRVAIAKAERAMKDQDKRRNEKDTIVDALKRGAAIYGDPDSQDAISFAAGVLKEEGNLQAYEAFMNELGNRKASEPNFQTKIRSLVTRPEGTTAKQILTYDNIADGFLGTKYQTDLTGTGAVSLDDTMVGKFFGGDKLNQQVEKRITTELTSRGLIVDQTTGVELPESYFDRDAYIIYKMTPEQRVAHYQGVLNDPNVTDGKVRDDAEAKVKENQAIIDKLEFEQADASGRINILTSRYQINRIKATNAELPMEERVAAGKQAKAELKLLGKYQQGKDIITGELGDIDQQLGVLRRQYIDASDVAMPGQTISPKAQLREAIEQLEATKRELASFAGTMSEQTAYAIDEAIRNGDSAGLEQALATARNIDAVNDATKNIKPAEHAAANSAITNLALTKLKLNPEFGVGIFERMPSGEIQFIGPDDMKERAAAELKKIISEVTNDAIAVARTERDKNIFTETARILGVQITQSTATPGSAADQTAQMLGAGDTATVPAADIGVTDSSAESPVLSSDKKQEATTQLSNKYAPDGQATDITAVQWITDVKNDNKRGNATDEQIVAAANRVNPTLGTMVEAQLSNFYKNKYETASDYGDFLASQVVTRNGKDVPIFDMQTTNGRQKVYEKLMTMYGADESEAAAIVTRLQTQAQEKAKKAAEETPETFEERQKRIDAEEQFRQTYGVDPTAGVGQFDTSVSTAIGG
jgi:hypothetical protein